ncbi:MAG: DUF3592 domain-containing protein [Lewinella sp.]|uniref:DUF3592 domain-containing protein n=1 Tax=Lewinella sp. TaxID=2004506 RepID=UPI003D6B2565
MKKSPRGNGNVVLIIFLGMFILPGLSIGLYGTVMSVVAQSWTPVEATIEKIIYEASSSSSPRSGRGKRSSRKKRSVRRMRVAYSYQWQGDTITSDRNAFVQGFSTKKMDRNKIEEKLVVGEKIVAYINPRNPEKAVLVRGIHNSILFFYVSAISCSLAFAAISGIFLGYPSVGFGTRSLVVLVLLYIVYFGIGIDRSVLRLIEVVP